MFADDGENVFNVVAGIDDHSLARGFVSDHGAVALERADGEHFVDHLYIVGKLVSSCHPARCRRSRILHFAETLVVWGQTPRSLAALGLTKLAAPLAQSR